MWHGFEIPAQCFLSINEIEKRRSLSRAQLTVGGGQVFAVGGNCVATDVDHEIYVVKDLSNFCAQVSIILPSWNCLNRRQAFQTNPYLNDLHAYACLGLPGASSQTNSWDIRCRGHCCPGSNTLPRLQNTLATLKRKPG